MRAETGSSGGDETSSGEPKRPRPLRRVLLFVGIAGVAVALTLPLRWYSATPTFSNPCGGVIASEVERLEAAGHTEYRVQYIQDERLGVSICPFTDQEGVTVTRAFVAAPRNLAFQPAGWERHERTEHAQISQVNGGVVPFVPFELNAQSFDSIVLWFEMEYCNFSGLVWLDEYSIEYEYRGRTRTTQLPLGGRLSVAAAENQCSQSVRDADAARSLAWSEAIGDRLLTITGVPTVGPLELSPENVSRDLCRYLRGVIPPMDQGTRRFASFEPLGSRAVFQLDDAELSATLIDGAVLGICPEFEERHDELLAFLD